MFVYERDSDRALVLVPSDLLTGRFIGATVDGKEAVIQNGFVVVDSFPSRLICVYD